MVMKNIIILLKNLLNKPSDISESHSRVLRNVRPRRYSIGDDVEDDTVLSCARGVEERFAFRILLPEKGEL